MSDQIDLEQIKLDYFEGICNLYRLEVLLGTQARQGGPCPHAAQWCPFWSERKPATLEALNASNTGGPGSAEDKLSTELKE